MYLILPPLSSCPLALSLPLAHDCTFCQVRRGPFTPEEDAVILVAHEIHNNKWATISKMLPGR